MIGDKDPEDVWDDVDPFAVRVALLARIFLAAHDDPDGDRRRRRLLGAARLAAKLGEG